MFARLTEDYEEDRHLIPKDRLVELRYEDFVKDPVASMRDIYQRLDIPDFDQAEAPMREFLAERSEHKVSRYEMPARAQAQSDRSAQALYRPLRLSRRGRGARRRASDQGAAAGTRTVLSRRRILQRAPMHDGVVDKESRAVQHDLERIQAWHKKGRRYRLQMRGRFV